MIETYKKIDDNTLEVTSISVSQNDRKHIEAKKQRAEGDILEAQKRIDKINTKLTVLDKELDKEL